jgi:hypothetical protein
MRKIIGEAKEVRQVQVSLKGEMLCQCGKPGVPRFDNDLPAGVHCDTCWEKLLKQCKSKSW